MTEAELTKKPIYRWFAMLERTVKFVEKHGRFPSRSGKTKEEQTTGKWRADQNGYVKRNLLSKEKKKAFIDAGLFGTIYNQKWNETLKEVIQFHKKHGFLPRTSGDTVEEMRLANWCCRNRKAVGEQHFSEESKRTSLINAARINDKKSFKSRWEVSCNRLIEFCNKNDKLPAYDSTGEEKLNYGWLAYQKNQLNKGLLTKEREEKIASILREYQPAKLNGKAKWDYWYSRLSVFIDRKNRLPAYSKKGTAEEKLAIWLHYQKWLIQNGKLSEREKNLLSKLHASLSDIAAWVKPGTEKDRDRWESNYQYVKSYITNTGYMPRQHKDFPVEKRMYSWFLRELVKVESGLLNGDQASRIVQLRKMVQIRKPGPQSQPEDSSWIQ